MSGQIAVPRAWSPRRAAASVAGTGDVPLALKVLLIANLASSTSNYNPQLLGLPEGSNLQQFATLGLWFLLIGLSLAMKPRARMTAWLDIVVGVGFFAFAVASVLWSDLEVASILKAIVLAITTYGCYRVALVTPVPVVADCAIFAFGLVNLASLAVVVVRPDIGITHDYFHEGLWSGIFESKQSLGFNAAFLMFFAACRFMAGGSRLVCAAAFVLGVVCVLGSGSRGGGAAALLATACVVLAGRRLSVSRVLVFVPTVIAIAALVILLQLQASGLKTITLFGTETDLTERVIIWQYALGHLHLHQLFGFGLNGFWSNEDVLFSFKRENGWVLDNYHNGYLAILMETGLVGFSLFVATWSLFGWRMSRMAALGMVEAGSFNLVVGFVCLLFIDNATETFFLRSTNVVAALGTIFLFASALRPVGVAAGRRTRRTRARVAPASA